MKKNSKVIALLLCASLLACSGGPGTRVKKTQAASLDSRSVRVLKTVEGTEPSTADAVKTAAPDETGQTEAPAGTENPAGTADAAQTQLPTSTPTADAVQVTIPPLQTPASGTTPSAVSPSAVYAVGDKLTVGNYVYAVEKAPGTAEPGTVKVKSLTDAAKKKTSLNVPATITKDGYTFSVTGIGKKAFTTSTAVKKVIIRKNVTFIGVRAFQGVKTLQTVTIGENVTTIKNRAFAGCSALRAVTVPSKVKLIGIRAFYNCTKLKSVLIESKKITSVKTSAFNKNKSGRYFVVPSGKKSLYQSLIKSSGASVKFYTY